MPDIKIYILLLCLGFLVYPCVSYTQNNIIDSLEKVLQTQKEDSNKALTLNRLSENLIMEGQAKKSMEYANSSILLSEKINFKRTEASAFENRGTVYAQQADYSNAEKDILTSLRIRKEIGDKRGIAQSYWSIGNLYYVLVNYPEALQNFYSALNIFQEIDNKKGIAITSESLSAIYLDQENDSAALKSMQLALKAEEQSGQKFSVGNAYFGLGAIELARKNYEEALKYYFKAFNIFKDYGQSKTSIADSYGQIGYIYEMQGEIAFSMGDKIRAFEKYDNALKYYDSSMKICRELNLDNRIVRLKGLKARVLIKFKRFKEAKEFLEEYLQYCQKYKSNSDFQEYYSIHAELDSTLGNYKQAYENYKMYVLYRDSLSSAENTKKAFQVKMQYDFDKKEAIARTAQDKKDAQAKRIKNQQYFAIASLAALVFAVLIIAFIQFRNNKQKQKANLLITLQKQKVETTLNELKSTQSQLIQSEKMASLGELTAGIAHEIQNPLNFVNNFSEVNKELLDEMENELNAGNKEEAISIAKDIKENEEKINHHGKRADAIVKGMLQHSRSSSGEKALTDMNALADEYLRLSYHGFRARDKTFNATLETNYDAGLGKINIIPQDIGRVLLNLYNNAFYAVNEKKKKLSDEYEPTISVGTKKLNDKIQVTVRDNGNGIPQKVLDKIYQPFFTTKPTGQGTGLGLSLSYDIIKAHGGDLKVETKEGEGAAFIIQLPIV